MGKNKLKKFNEIAQMDFVHQYPFARLQLEGFPLKGHWNEKVFKNSNPIVLELGCGKGEYTVNLALQNPQKNYVGIDIKGARMWTGAKQAHEQGMSNVAFLRTSIELLDQFFAPGEVSEIWITFPDPQMKKARKRLTSTRFLELYSKVLKPGGIIHLKTDSPFLYTYTSLLVKENNLPVEQQSTDVHSGELASHPVLSILTHYEKQWIERGLTIKYISFRLDPDKKLVEPEIEIEHDTYRSYSRGVVQCPEKCSPEVLQRSGII